MGGCGGLLTCGYNGGATVLPPTATAADTVPTTHVQSVACREEEAQDEGDSVTKLHGDMSDAVNILVHAQYAPEEAGQATVRCGDEEVERPRWVGLGGCGR